MESDEKTKKDPIPNPFGSGLGEIIMMTDHIPTKEEILEAKKRQLREVGML